MAKILVIDDDWMVRCAIRIALEATGHELEEAADGAVGLEKVASFAPDLVITDIIMPEKEGLETIRTLQQKRPDLPIIAISGGGRFGPADFLKIARRFGAAATIRKPFDEVELIAAIDGVLSGEILPEPA